MESVFRFSVAEFSPASLVSHKVVDTKFVPRTLKQGLRTPTESFFFQKLETFGLGQTNWAEII